jgi:hypothetical protein
MIDKYRSGVYMSGDEVKAERDSLEKIINNFDEL